MLPWDWPYTSLFKMIEINLVPQSLQKKRKKKGIGLNIPREIIIGLIGGVIVLLVIASILMQVMIYGKHTQLTALKKEWEGIEPSKKRVDDVLQKLRLIQTKVKSIEEITGVNKVIWSHKLNIISDVLPRGLWLNRIVVSDRVLLVEGSSYSKDEDQMISVHKFANDLKNQAHFMDDLKTFELGSIQRRNIQSIEVADFKITAEIKE